MSTTATSAADWHVLFSIAGLQRPISCPRPISWTGSSRNHNYSVQGHKPVNRYCIREFDFSAERIPSWRKWLLADALETALHFFILVLDSAFRMILVLRTANAYCNSYDTSNPCSSDSAVGKPISVSFGNSAQCMSMTLGSHARLVQVLLG